jgi:hypothetical protein
MAIGVSPHRQLGYLAYPVPMRAPVRRGGSNYPPSIPVGGAVECVGTPSQSVGGGVARGGATAMRHAGAHRRDAKGGKTAL